LRGEVPEEYLAQVHGSMFVTGRSEWKFMSYRPFFPTLLLTVFRDDKIQAVLQEALEGFLDKLERGMKRLEEINGGPPHRSTVKRRTQAEIDAMWERAGGKPEKAVSLWPSGQ
jgi:hypothetical protein